MRNLQDTFQTVILFLCFFCTSFQAFSQEDKMFEKGAKAIIGKGVESYQKNRLEKSVSRDRVIIATIPASTRIFGNFEEGYIVVTNSNIHFDTSKMINLTGTIVVPLTRMAYKKTTYELPFGIYKRDAVEITYNGETRLFVFYKEDGGEWELFRKAITKANNISRK